MILQNNIIQQNRTVRNTSPPKQEATPTCFYGIEGSILNDQNSELQKEEILGAGMYFFLLVSKNGN